MRKVDLKEAILEQEALWARRDSGIERQQLSAAEAHLQTPHTVLISGIRRCGKSTLLRQLATRHYPKQAYHLSFEDERFIDFTAKDFSALHECFIELYGERKVFFLDELQNVPHWETFVRRMQDQGYKFFITGSNASLLSRELGTKLTGRSVAIELFPFSFGEYLRFRGHAVTERTWLQVSERAALKNEFTSYLHYGGMPEFLQYQDIELIKRLYEDILYRDIVARHAIKDIRALRELGLFYLSHPGSRFSFNKLKATLQLGSMNTVHAYTDHFEDSYLLFTLPRFSYSLKQQFVSEKKAYCVDNGFIEAIAFQFSKNRGHLLENLVYTALRRKTADLFLYQTQSGKEVDFLVRRGRDPIQLIQVTQHLADAAVRERELTALQQAIKELKLPGGLLLTEDEEPDELFNDFPEIQHMPIHRWLLESA